MRNHRVATAMFFKGKPPWWYRNRTTRAVLMPIHRRRAIRRMRRSPSAPPPPTRDRTGPAPELIRVVPFGRRADFDGGRWWVTALTVWDDRVGVEAAVWDDTWSDEPPVPPRMVRGAPRFHWRMLLEDEAGTAYLPKGGGGGGSTGHWHRVASEFEPSIPADATALTVVLTRRAWPFTQGEPPAQPVEVARVTIDIR